MATTLWGNVYYKDIYAGKLQELPGNRYSFTYDPSYIDAGYPAISYTLPLQSIPFISERELHSFFANLVAEDWVSQIQARELGIHSSNKFGLLLGFGYDLAGAVSIRDPEPNRKHNLANDVDAITSAVLMGRASLSGVQRKFLAVYDGKNYRSSLPDELSTHIVKVASDTLPNLIELEFLATLAVRTLLPDDEVVDLEIRSLPNIEKNTLIITRFDRNSSGKWLYHFEEFNQLLGHHPDQKYQGSYKDMANFMKTSLKCSPPAIYQLFQRILACLLIGNTDAHLKNFAMFHTQNGFRLTPAYDLVASAMYPQYSDLALKIGGINMPLSQLSARNLLKLGEEFAMTNEQIINIIETFSKRLNKVFIAINKADLIPEKLRKDFINKVEKRWNGTFKLIGHHLSKKQNKDVKKLK